ncbi:MAG: hypothetical protein J7M14_06310 [Planctomycetes bacterium]|nr:hypothetical protein [Planctomycetota bacterium]
MSDNPMSNIPGRITAPAEMLEDAIAELLRRIPETWQAYRPDDLSETKAQAIFLLTAAGMVERRERLRLRFASHPVAAEATITFAGEYGGIEAMESITARLWDDWQDAYAAWKKGDAANVSPAHCERLEPTEWRLTDQGVIARKDLDGTGPQGADMRPLPQGTVFDFVLKKDFFKRRAPVRGKGALVKMDKTKADAAPDAVSTGNRGAGVDWLELKPNVFGLGINFNAILKSSLNVFRRKAERD